MVTSDKGLELIKFFESIHDGDMTKIGLQPKLCPAGIFSIGWGHAVIDPKTNKFVTKDTSNGYAIANALFKDLTLEQAEALLMKDLSSTERTVNRLVTIPIKQYQFDALVSHVFNCGVSETLFELVNSQPSLTVSLRNWWTTRYIKGGGVVLNGLIKRRKVEYELFSTGILNLD